MRSVKVLCLAALALVATATMGAGSASATKLCKAPPEKIPLVCPTGQGYAGESLEAILETKSYAVFKRLKGGLAGGVKCTESKATATIEENGLSPPMGGIESVEFRNGGKPSCPTSFFGLPEAEVTLQNLPYHATTLTYIGAAAPQGEMEIPNNLEIKVRVLAGMEYSCFYKAKEDAATMAQFDNPTATTTAKLKFKGALFALVAGGELCPEEGEFNATYDVKRTNPGGEIYIANS